MRLVEIPAGAGGIALIDPAEVRAIEPSEEVSGKSFVHMAGDYVYANLSVEECAKRLFEGHKEVSMEEDHYGLLIKRAEGVLDAWKLGGEQLYEAIVELECAVAQAKGAGYR